MALTFVVTELPWGRSSGGNRKEHTHVRRFSVRASEPCTTDQAAGAPGVPLFGSFFSGPNGYINAGLFARRKNARALDAHRNYYEVDVEYSNVLDFAPGGLDNAGNPLEEFASPLDEPWAVRFGTATVTENILEDDAGTAILNAAGAPYESGIPVERGHLTMTVTRNEDAASFDAVAMNELAWHANESAWRGWAAKTVLLTSVETGDRRYDRGVLYYPVTYQLKFARAGRDWRRRLLNYGGYYLKAAGSTVKVRFMDESFGQQLPHGLLAADGTKLNYPANPPVYLHFEAYPTADFDLLGMN